MEGEKGIIRGGGGAENDGFWGVEGETDARFEGKFGVVGNNILNIRGEGGSHGFSLDLR